MVKGAASSMSSISDVSPLHSPERMQVGFKTLRGFIVQRPSLRSDALNVLLELTTHSEKNIRLAAINTVKAWVPNSPPMDGMIRDFALQMLKKLQSRTTRAPTVPQGQEDGEDVHMENGAGEPNSTEPNSITDTKNAESKSSAVEEDRATPDDLVQTPYLPDRIELPAEKGQVLQHLELVFALCVKAPEFLEAYVAGLCDLMFLIERISQNLRGVRSNGYNSPGGHSGADHRPDSLLRLKSWEASHIDAELPSRVGVARLASVNNLH